MKFVFYLMLACSAFGQAFTFNDPPFLGNVSSSGDCPGVDACDPMETYTDAVAANGLSGGLGSWAGAYVDRNSVFGIQANDDMESYSAAVALNGLNGYYNVGWGGAYVDKCSSLGQGIIVSDDIESYTTSANLDGLNGGTGDPFAGCQQGSWSGAFVDKCTPFGLAAYDNLSSYSTSAAVDGLNADTGSPACQYFAFSAAYVAR